MEATFSERVVADGVRQLTDVNLNRAYLVMGSQRAALIDTMEGVGNLRARVEELCDLPVTVLLTHHHHDHIGGAYFYDEAYLSEADDGRWDQEEAFHLRIQQQFIERFELSESTCWPVTQGTRPQVRHISEGDEFDLGGLHVRAVALPGHTRGSMGYLIEERRLLLSGDAVTPIMTLYYEDSLDIDGWEETLRKMQGLPFDTFMTGHHDRAFTKEDLSSFLEVAEFSKADRGMTWANMSLPELTGTLHVMSPLDMDPDSEDYRGLIERLKPRERRRGRRRHQREGGQG